MIRTRNEVGGMTETLGGAWDIIRSEVAAKTAQCMRVPTLLQIKRDSGQWAMQPTSVAGCSPSNSAL